MIRNLHPAELPLLEPLGRQFEKDSQFVEFNMSEVIYNWERWIRGGIGVVIGYFEGDKLVGCISALKHPDIHSGKMTAVECFLLVLEEYRKGMIGIRLIKAFEEWADDNGCKRKGLVHLSDSMPEKLTRLYERLGYSLLETHYLKDDER